jgi:hypothetical protein
MKFVSIYRVKNKMSEIIINDKLDMSNIYKRRTYSLLSDDEESSDESSLELSQKEIEEGENTQEELLKTCKTFMKGVTIGGIAVIITVIIILEIYQL